MHTPYMHSIAEEVLPVVIITYVPTGAADRGEEVIVKSIGTSDAAINFVHD